MNQLVKREQRVENILLSLKKLSYLSRSQIQALHDLGGERNAQKILKSMSEYLNSFREGETVYYLSKEGRERIGASRVNKKTTTAQHYIMRNTLYIGYQSPKTWKNEIRFSVEGIATVICDATFTHGEQRYIIEVDYTQKMNANKAKIQKYKKLIDVGAFGKVLPKFVWITTTEYRRKQLQKLSNGLDIQVFTISEFN
ncbi:replication-relaxation family protein [Priestia aryabhattai]|uniref:replication-relaxation family protein n=1 Tax=Priestia aryabhattai TaxID=412384 RepID=UPI00356662D9